MITCSQIKHSVNARIQKTVPFGLGNTLFMIASTIGIAIKNGYEYGFDNFLNQEYFVNKLPHTSRKNLPVHQIPINYKGFDIGFRGFDVPDNRDLKGYMGSWKYFEHCENLIRYYFTLKDLCEPLKDCIIISYRDYSRELADSVFQGLDYDYFQQALSYFPDKRVVVISDNIEAARKVISKNYEFIHNSPIIDFYLIAHADYLIMSPSTFSWWGAYLSGAQTIAPDRWFWKDWSDCPTEDIYLSQWIRV